MGSGHILVYAFDVFMQLYEAEGESARRAAELILQNNLFGLDIDKRAFQLAYFALMMKGREYNRRILSRDIRPNVYDIPDNSGLTEDDIVLLPLNFPDVEKGTEDLKQLIHNFKDGNDLGSLIQFQEIDFENLEAVYQINNEQQLTFDEYAIYDMIQVAKLLSQKYQISITNPPYMGSSGMNKVLGDFVKKQLPDSKSDLFAVFMERIKALTSDQGYYAMITQHAWMFLSSFEKLRKKVNEQTIHSMIHLGTRAFEEIGGEVVQTTAFVMQPTHHKNYLGSYLRLVDFANHKLKERKTLEAIGDGNADYLYHTNQDNFTKIPGMPISYWVSDNVINSFEKDRKISDYAFVGLGMRTGDNNRFLRYWFEICHQKFDSKLPNPDFTYKGVKWVPYNKGGSFRKWYGNNEYVVNWENDGKEIKDNTRRVYPQLGDNLGWKITNEQYYFKPSITWTFISSSKFGVRYSSIGTIFDVAGSSLFIEDEKLRNYFGGFLNSKLAFDFLQMQNPTLNFQVANIKSLPVRVDNVDLVSTLVNENTELAKLDWDSFETSWDFINHPFMKYQGKLEQRFYDWKSETANRFNRLSSNECELNQIFINLYELQDEVTSKVDSKDISIRVANQQYDIKSFISYAVGCIFGRYSLDINGLAYAGGQWKDTNYQSFRPDKDNILLISDDNYFEESSIDIVNRFVEFIRIALGEENIEENLQFIADTLGGKGTTREIIRNYFVKDFFKDHLQIYKKRPIYWQFESGKDSGFKALIYLHRYTPDVLGAMRVDYLHQLQRAYENTIEQLQSQIQQSSSSMDKNAYTKQLQKIRKQYEETKDYDAKLGHLANMKIELDLDDGIILNYDKLQTDENSKNLKVLSKRA